jgi:uncharacterized RDD family membrane protein YckC
MATRHTLPPQLGPAPVRRRLAAYLVDAALVVAAGYLVAALLDAAIGPSVRLVVDGEIARVVVDAGRLTAQAVVVTLVSAAYFGVSWSRWSATPGQRLLGLRVLDVETLRPLRPGRSLARWATLGGPLGILAAVTIDSPFLWSLVAAAAIVLGFVLLVSTARTSTRRGVHDRVAKSIVVIGGGSEATRPPEVGSFVSPAPGQG